MSENTLQAYRHSGKFTLPGLTLPIAAAVVAGFPLGLAYAHLTRWIPFIYINVLLAAGYGFVIGWIATRLVKIGLVRNVAVATAAGAFAGIVAVYAEWSGFIHAVWDEAPWFSTPDMVMAAMNYLYENGSWGLRSGGNVTGIALLIVWIIEAGIIIGIPVAMTWNFVRSTPFCEKTHSWLDHQKTIDTLQLFSESADLTALAAGDLGPVIAARPREAGATDFGRLLLKTSPRSQHFSTVTVQNVSISFDKEGKSSEKVENLTGDLMVPPAFIEELTHLALLAPAKSGSPAPA